MKKLLLLLLTIMLGLGSMQLSAQQIVEIPGNGGTATDGYLPSYCLYNYSLTQQIYTSAEIGMSGTITSIAFYNEGSYSRTRNLSIYLVHTNKTSFSGSSDWITVTAADLAYSGNVTFPIGAWTSITLTTPFVYDGASNLAVIVDDNTGSWESTTYYRVFDATGMALRIYSDPTDYDPTSPSSYSGTVMDIKNQIQLEIIPGDISCHSTGTLTVSNITAYNADITWGTPEDAGSYILQYKTSDLDWDDDDVVTEFPIDTFFSFSNPLLASTTYNVRVANMCSNGDTSLWRSTTFRTACAPIDQLPYTENFDTYGTGGASNYPSCWTKYSTYTSGTTPYISSTNYQGSGSLYFYVGSATQYNMAIMPAVDEMIPINTLQVSFAYRASNATDRLIVGVVDDFTDGSTFTPVDTVYPVAGSVSTWDERIVTFDQYTGTGTYIAFKNEYTSTYCYAYIDNVTLDVISTCLKPADVAITNYTSEGADIIWTPRGEESSWEIAVVLANGDPDTCTPVSASTHPFTLTGLQDDTNYDIYVRAVCGSEEYSGWTFKHTFRTNPSCSSPLNVRVSQITTNSALVTWDEPIFGPGSYTVGYSEADQNNWNVQSVTGSTQFMISGLTINTEYDVFVVSNCSEDEADTVFKSFTTRSCMVGGDLEIGTGTTTSGYLPDYTYYNYAYSQQIYLASEMNGAANLQSIAFNAATVNTPTRTIKLYLMHTNQAGTSWVNSSTAQLVYDGSFTWTTGWNTIQFTSPFQYNGVDNLAVIMVDETGSWTDANSFYCHSTPQSLSAYVYNDNSAYTLPPTSSPSTSSNRNNVIFGVPCDSTATCSSPNPYVTNVTDNSITVAWIPGNTETSWEMEYMIDSVWISEGSVTSPHTITGLSENTNIVVRIRSLCGGSNMSEWAITSAQTNCSVINTLPYTENFDPVPGSASNSADCWSTITNSSTSYPYLSSTYAYSEDYSVYFYGSSAYFSYLVSPEIDASISINDLQVRFWAYKTTPTYYIQVGVMTDPTDYSTFELLSDNLTPTNNSEWQLLDVNLDEYTGNGHYIAFRIPQSYLSYMYVDNITFDLIPTCAHVTDIVVDNITGTTATISWTEGDSESAWDLAIVPGTDEVDMDTVNYTSVTGSPEYLAEDLNPNTVYTVYVRANCGNATSFWWNTTFMTTQIPAILPYDCDFEDADEAASFSFINGTETNQWVVGTAANNGGTHSMYISSNNGVTNTYDNTTSNVWAYRDIEFPANPSGYILSFDWRSNGESSYDYMRVFVGAPVPVTAGTLSQPDGSTALVPNYNTDNPNYFNTATSYQTYSMALPGLDETTVLRIYFLWHNDGSVSNMPPASVDNISITEINCDAPTALTVDSTSTTTADISWATTATSSVIFYKGDNDPDWTEIPSVTSPYQITNLTANTHYIVRVANECEDGDNISPYISISFYTECDVINTLPYTENFDSYTAGTSSRPHCWSFPIVSGSAPYIVSTQYSSTPNSLYFQSPTTTPTTAVSPQFGADINTLRVKFMLKAESTTSSGTFEVGVMSDPTDVTTFESVRIIQPANTSWNQYVVDFDSTTMTGPNRYIAFRQNSNSSSYYYWLDNVMVMNIPSCPEPSDLTSVANTTTSITLGWTPGGGETDWNIQYGTTGFTLGEGTTELVTTNPYEIENLDADSTYDFYVQAVCGAGDESIWVGPYTIQPGTYIMPSSGSNSISACALTIYDDGGPNGDYSSSCNSTLTINPETPGNLVAISGTVNTESCCDYLRIYDGSDITGTMLGEFKGENLTITELISSTGPLTLVFYSDGSVVKSGFALTVTCIPNTCPKPTDLTVSNIGVTSADLTWMPGGTESSWIVEYKESSETTWTTDVAYTPSYSFTDLTGLTTYDVRVKADCGDETSQYTTTSFTTPNCPAADACFYTFVLTDSYGDGWNGGSLTVQQDGATIAVLEMTAGSSVTETVTLCDNLSTSLLWTSGTYEYEAGFSIAGPDGTVIFSHDSMSTYTTYTFTTDCNGSGPVITDPTVATNAATAIGQTAATLNASITNPSSVTITAKGFEWKTTTGGTYTQIAGTGTGNTFTANLTTLTPGTSYTFKAFITYNGNTVYGDELTFTTQQQGQPTEPSATTADATNVTYNAATLNGSVANPDNVTITAQGFEWKAASASTYTTVNATGATMAYNLTGLNATTTYTYRAFVTTANGTHYGQDKTFTTEAEPVEPCDAPTGLTATNVQSESITVTWDNAAVLRWNLQYGPIGGTLASATATTNSYTITNLTPLTTYQIRVQAVCEEGNESEWSSSIEATTTNLNSYLESNVTLYPNPAKEFVDVRVDGDVNVIGMEVYDVYGKLINTVNVIDNLTHINVSSLANGMYFVRVTTEQGVVTKRFVKK